MLIPAPNSDWWLFIKAATAIVLAMAGGMPCCCDHPVSSTSTDRPPPTSTSTSTSTPPPLPPLPPTSTSSQPPFDPPRRSSSVGEIIRFDCNYCYTDELLADQWMIEFSGIQNCAPPYCTDCASLDGAYILDSISSGGYNDGSLTGCGRVTIFGELECDPGFGDPDDNLTITVSFLAAGSNQPFGPPPGTITASSRIGFGLSDIVPPNASMGALWTHHWVTGLGDPIRKVPCRSELPGFSIPFETQFPVCLCDFSAATAIPFEVEGF